MRDPFELRVPGYGLNRDPERAPMGWDGSEHAGFTTRAPWLPLGDDIEECNVAAQREQRRSMLRLYYRLLELRRSEPVLLKGASILGAFWSRSMLGAQSRLS